jgi:fatty acid amide hydrolase
MSSVSVPAAEVLDLGALELRDRIARGELSCREVVEAFVRRIEATHARLNAVVVPLFEQAREQARAADEARERGEPLGPLHGVPVTVKEMFDVAGTPTTSGVPHWAAVRASADAPLVAQLRRAGAIVLGKTNVAQVGMMFESDNPVYGRTNNPWRPDRAAGGSSGGEAAVLAAGGSALGLGSDGGGSIRHPCHCCGVHGLKPTGGRLTLRGHWMLPNWSSDWVQPGPMARHVADLALALRVLAAPGQEAFDPDIAPVPLGDPAAVSLQGLRVGAYEDDGQFRAGPALRRAVREAAAALRERGAVVEDFRPPDVPEAVRLYYGLAYHDGMVAMRRYLGRGPTDWRVRRVLLGASMPSSLRPALAWLFDRLGRRYDAQFYRFVPRRRLSFEGYWRLIEDQAAYRARFAAALDAGRYDALLCPPNGLPAPTHGCFYNAVAGSYGLLYNLLGLPAGVVAATRVRPGEESDRPPSKDPAEETARAVEAGSAGLPVGVQVAGRPWREDVALAVMAALEDHFRTQPDYPARPPLE